MTTLPKINRRGWLALWAQGRRRQRQVQRLPAPVPAAPVITNGSFEWGASAADWFDITLQWTFDHGGYPVAQLEVHQSENGGPFYLTSVVSSDVAGVTLEQVTDSETTLRYQVRYRNGTLSGPFSNECVVDCVF